ncbi:DUF805 domain-containing protein [Streptomyces sp. UNOC14_S4]|uniref:DUF805 domain-containing protein n=1 Tax=Streptomyces sp. UNOC14_S4 TaxID=2872340 RepID=UPI001E49D470|nr:DUF805 domain-containing protein [Streptomyces sp. UNOC14_S4]MCC3766688.1 DUF805 domain-containing protein [Streptomyces sp. UNOC14_S4]
MHRYTQVLKKYTEFSGRAGRPEYWYFFLFNLAISIVLMIIDMTAGTYPLFEALYTVAVLLPSLAVTARRLHDTGRSAWWILIGLVPFVGGIVLLILAALPSVQRPNAYGPVPQQEVTA